MGNRSVNRRATAKAGSTSWKLKPDTARKTQGLIASHFGHLPAAMALFLALPMGAGGAWLLALRQVLEFTDATGSREDPSAAAIAFTYSGLLVMKLPTEALDSFSVPFREGMHQVDRQRRLRDDPALSTVVAGGPRWSGNLLEAGQPPTPLTVHVALLVYELDDERLDAVVRRVEGVLSAEKVKISHRVRLRIDIDDVTREHFGFADGISQPVPIGDAIVPPSGPDAATQLHWHGVKAGEILLGHENIHNERAPGPVLSADAAGNTKRLSKNGAPQGFLDLGLNGSYLVIRELKQDVAGFWRSMEAAAQAIGAPHVDGRWIAERVIGRTLDGDVLLPEGATGPSSDQGQSHQANNFGFARTDVHGFGCPLGSHIRRANPRDSLPSRDSAAPVLTGTPELLDASKAHRILRRGRKYGPDIADTRHDDAKERGLLFMCLNSDLVRHFEFVQQSWLLNPSFATLFDETDPLLGPHQALDPPRKMSIPACPIRWRPEVHTYVQMAGGEYFFLPSIPALDYLASL